MGGESDAAAEHAGRRAAARVGRPAQCGCLADAGAPVRGAQRGRQAQHAQRGGPEAAAAAGRRGHWPAGAQSQQGLAAVAVARDLRDQRAARAASAGAGARGAGGARRSLMRVQVRHAVPGRLRVALPAWRGDVPRLAQLAQRIEHLKGVTHTRVNAACGSLLIEYEPPSAKLEQRLLGWLARDAALERAHGEARLPAASAALALSLKRSTAPLSAAATLYAARGSGRRAW